jgi:maltooligosyltrehalose trehalohydrolase
MDSWPLLGAVPRSGGTADFNVWAPARRSVAVRANGRDVALDTTEEGLFAGTIEARAGDEYRFVLDGESAWPDPCSRLQADGIHGASTVVDLDAFVWHDGDRPGLTLDELVVYELHVGAFSSGGTFADVADRLPELRELGVTAIEVMPIATFPGRRNWGYDGVYTFAPHAVYGGPEGFARLVDAAHEIGLGVILDVVYNHIGPGSDAIAAFAPYFTDRVSTFWGDTLDYRQRGVREWAIQNAEMWVRDYHVDALRLDAVHAVYDDGPRHVLAELAERVRAIDPRVLVIAEAGVGDERPIREWRHDAQWADEFHHVLHVLLTGERDGYYANYPPSVTSLGRQFERTPSDRFVVCSQNHDQVGNRAFGDRPKPRELRLRAAAALFAPQVPLLFMGEEYGEQRPFQFFTDHVDPAIAEATRQGRKREFERFASFSGEDVPDPQDGQTFVRSTLDPSAGDDDLRGFYRRLLALRHELPRETSVIADEDARLLRVRRGSLELVLNFSEQEREGVPPFDAVLTAARTHGQV